MSALPPKADITSGLIDYFIGTAEQRRRHGKAEHSGGVRIDDQLELVQLNNWQLRRLGAVKDAANMSQLDTLRRSRAGESAAELAKLNSGGRRQSLS
jgi:hypothetical protein